MPPAKRKALLAHLHLPSGPSTITTPALASSRPFEHDPKDAAETPFAAYQDIEPLLFMLAQKLGKPKHKLRIYDPYYCEGSVTTHLSRLGFTSVIHSNVDCYAAWREGTVPPFDVLLTNPPFSGEHIRRILAYAVSCGKPWFLLLPDFIAEKGYYKSGVGAGASPPLFVGPKLRPYTFTAPGRSASGDDLVERVRKPDPSRAFAVFAAKFSCVWYVALGAHAEAVRAWWEKRYALVSKCVLASAVAGLPVVVKPPPVEGAGAPAVEEVAEEEEEVEAAPAAPAAAGSSKPASGFRKGGARKRGGAPPS